MSLIGKLLDITSLGTTVAGFVLLQRLVTRVIVVVALTIMSSMMAILMMLAGFYALYTGLVSYGLTAQAAMVVTGAFAFLATFLLFSCTIFHLRQLRKLHRRLIPEVPAVNEILSLAGAFAEGFFSPR